MVKVDESVNRIQETKTISLITRFDASYLRIRALIDYISVLRKNKFDLQEPVNLVEDLDPSWLLWEYAVQEISSFYTNASQDIENKSLFPIYWEEMKEFRNAIPGHLDKERKLVAGKDWLKKYSFFRAHALDVILNDFNECYEACRKIIQEKEI